MNKEFSDFRKKIINMIENISKLRKLDGSSKLEREFLNIQKDIENKDVQYQIFYNQARYQYGELLNKRIVDNFDNQYNFSLN